MESAPHTGRTSPERESSPEKHASDISVSPSSPAHFIIERSIARSYAEPSFFLSAGARFSVISASGKKNPLLINAARILSFASFIAASGSPTISKSGRRFCASHSTVTMYPSMPVSPALKTFESIVKKLLYTFYYILQQKSFCDKFFAEKREKHFIIHKYKK